MLLGYVLLYLSFTSSGLNLVIVGIGALWLQEQFCLGYRGKWLVLVRDIKKQPQVLEILLELVVEKNAKDMMEDLDDAGVPLEEYSDDEDAAGM